MNLFNRFKKQVPKKLVDAMKPSGNPRQIQFYLYFPTQEVANKAQAALFGEADMTSEVREAAVGDDYLLLVTMHSTDPALLLNTNRAKFEKLAAQFGGEYDGWEAEANRG
jgi:hypothetical protein